MRGNFVTWISSRGETINVSAKQEQELTRAGRWPKDSKGEEFARVCRGLSFGMQSNEDRKQIEDLIG